jgi:hypothetical protein
MNYFYKFIPILKDILRVTLGVTLPADSIIINYSKTAFETIESFMSSDNTNKRNLYVMSIEQSKNEMITMEK